jgi:hypothetical protein
VPHAPEVLGRVHVELAVLLDDVLAYVAVLLLDALGRLQAVLRRHGLAALAQHALDEGGDVAARQRDVPDAGADDVAVRDRDDVRHAVARVYHRARQRPVLRGAAAKTRAVWG